MRPKGSEGWQEVLTDHVHEYTEVAGDIASLWFVRKGPSILGREEGMNWRRMKSHEPYWTEEYFSWEYSC